MSSSGAFIAGVIVRRLSPPSTESALQVRIEAIGFGFLIPLFFVVSGRTWTSTIQNPAWQRLFISCRGLVQYLLYRREIPDRRERGRFALYVATGLPIIVAVTQIEVDAGVMMESTAASLVGAGVLTVLVFPIVGNLRTGARHVLRRGSGARGEHRLKHDAGRDRGVERLDATGHRDRHEDVAGLADEPDSPKPSAPTTTSTGSTDDGGVQVGQLDVRVGGQPDSGEARPSGTTGSTASGWSPARP